MQRSHNSAGYTRFSLIPMMIELQLFSGLDVEVIRSSLRVPST